jgi:hypothetical protein
LCVLHQPPKRSGSATVFPPGISRSPRQRKDDCPDRCCDRPCRVAPVANAQSGRIDRPATHAAPSKASVNEASHESRAG